MEVVSLDKFARYKMASVNVWSNGSKKTKEPVLIKKADLELHNQSFDSVSNSERAARQEIYVLEKKIRELEKAPAKPVAAAQPAARESSGHANVDSAQKKLDSINQRGAKLINEFNNATGPKRSQIKDQLWKLKGEQARAEAELAQAKAKAGISNTPAPRRQQAKPRESELSQLQKRLNTLREQVDNL